MKMIVFRHKLANFNLNNRPNKQFLHDETNRIPVCNWTTELINFRLFYDSMRADQIGSGPENGLGFRFYSPAFAFVSLVSVILFPLSYHKNYLILKCLDIKRLSLWIQTCHLIHWCILHLQKQQQIQNISIVNMFLIDFKITRYH